MTSRLFVVVCLFLAWPAAAADGPRLKPSDFRLVGGWRLAQEYPRGALAIDFDKGRVFMGGHAQCQEIVEFSLIRRSEVTGKPEAIAPGSGEDVMKWPRLDPVKIHAGFWEGGYVGGLYYRRDGTLWASPKKFYDMSPPSSFRLYGKNLETDKIETIEVGLPRQAFGGGFVKGKPDTMLLGCGGYESGQGSVAGPTLATVDGKVLIGQANHGTMEFEKRELRPATYWPAKGDGWLALQPRDNVGRWACDRVHAGGIWHPRGIAYWALLGIGDLDYARQNETFAARNETWLFTYDSKTYRGVEFNRWDHGHVHGHEVAEDGRVYLLIRNAWRSGVARVDSVIKVFEISE